MGATTTKTHSRKPFVDSLSPWLHGGITEFFRGLYRTEKLPKQQQKQSNKQQQKQGYIHYAVMGFIRAHLHMYIIYLVFPSHTPVSSPFLPSLFCSPIQCHLYFHVQCTDRILCITIENLVHTNEKYLSFWVWFDLFNRVISSCMHFPMSSTI